MKQDDLDDVVSIHGTAFRGFFLTRMGPRFLKGYYQAVLDFDASIAIVGRDAETGKAVGFAVGFRDPPGFYAFFGRRRRTLLPAILLAVMRDPTLLREIARSAQRVHSESHQSTSATELSSIAVVASGRGVGSSLLEAFLELAHNEGATKVSLTTDAIGNDDVLRFYEKHGFRLVDHEDRGERRLLRLEKALG